MLVGSILWAMMEHDAKCRWPARTSENCNRSAVWSVSGRGRSVDWSAGSNTKTSLSVRSWSSVPRFIRPRTASTVIPRLSEPLLQ